MLQTHIENEHSKNRKDGYILVSESITAQVSQRKSQEADMYLTEVPKPLGVTESIKRVKARFKLGEVAQNPEDSKKISTKPLVERYIRSGDVYSTDQESWKIRFDLEGVKLNIVPFSAEETSAIPTELTPGSVNDIEAMLWSRRLFEKLVPELGLSQEVVIQIVEKWKSRKGVVSGMREELANFIGLTEHAFQSTDLSQQIVKDYLNNYHLLISLKRTRKGEKVTRDPVNYRVAAAIAMTAYTEGISDVDAERIFETYAIKPEAKEAGETSDQEKVWGMYQKLATARAQSGKMTLEPVYSQNARIVGRMEVAAIVLQRQEELSQEPNYYGDSAKVIKRALAEAVVAMTLGLTIADPEYHVVVASISNNKLRKILKDIYKVNLY